jgi:hypothetical protein
MPKRPRPVNALRASPARIASRASLQSQESHAHSCRSRRHRPRRLAARPPNRSIRTEVGRILDEGFNRSEVMQTVQHLTDHIGPRLTNSPGMRAAEDWTLSQFRDWGLKNVRTRKASISAAAGGSSDRAPAWSARARSR